MTRAQIPDTWDPATAVSSHRHTARAAPSATSHIDYGPQRNAHFLCHLLAYNARPTFLLNCFSKFFSTMFCEFRIMYFMNINYLNTVNTGQCDVSINNVRCV